MDDTKLYYGSTIDNIRVIKDIFRELEAPLAEVSCFCKQVHKTFFKNDKEIDESWNDMIETDKIISEMSNFNFKLEWKTYEEKEKEIEKITNKALVTIIKGINLNNYLRDKWEM